MTFLGRIQPSAEQSEVPVHFKVTMRRVGGRRTITDPQDAAAPTKLDSSSLGELGTLSQQGKNHRTF